MISYQICTLSYFVSSLIIDGQAKSNMHVGYPWCWICILFYYSERISTLCIPWVTARLGYWRNQRVTFEIFQDFGDPGGCFTNILRAPQNILAKIDNTINHIYGEKFNLKICTCAQRLWAHVHSFSLKFSSQVLFVQYTNFERIFWRARETLVKQPQISVTGTLLWTYMLKRFDMFLNAIIKSHV